MLVVGCRLLVLFVLVDIHFAPFLLSLFVFTVDDKGPVAIAVFGLPYHAHEDDALRGVRFSSSFFFPSHLQNTTKKNKKEEERNEVSKQNNTT